ncbi:MAG: hypothetical protein PHW66_06365 [Gallionella sp.]|nr:hypothetical protein [Gallionella sp.]
MLKPQKPFHAALPIEAQQMLRRACQVQNTPDDPMAKIKAIDRANSKIRTMFPRLFKWDET